MIKLAASRSLFARRLQPSSCSLAGGGAVSSPSPYLRRSSYWSATTKPSLSVTSSSPSALVTESQSTHNRVLGGLCCRRPQTFSSADAAAEVTDDDTTTTSTTTTTDDNQTSSSQTLFMWGTDNNGCILKPEDRSTETKIDVPLAISDWRGNGGLHLDDDDDSSSTGTSLSSIDIVKMTMGPTDSAWLLSNGACYVAGENKNGQLGQGHKDPVKSPVPVTLPPGPVEEGAPAEEYASDRKHHITQVALGSAFSAFVDNNGDLYTSGFGGSAFAGLGNLGHGNGESYLSPTLVVSLVEDGCRVQTVAAGEAHMTVLTTEGEVLTTGAGSYGRLGNFDTIDQLYLEPVEVLTQGVTQIAGGKSFTLALTTDGVVYGWGRNHKGQLGTGLGLAVDMYAMEPVPSPIEADELVGRKVTYVAAGHSHAACITESGELFIWGMSVHLEPVRVNELLHTKIVDVVCGEDYTLTVDEQGRMYSMGKGKTGCLGQGGTVKQLNQATEMEALQDWRIKQVAAGWKHAACLAERRV